MHRIREFHMQNMHTICKDIEQGWKVFEDMWKSIANIFEDMGFGADIFVVYSERDIWEKKKDDILRWAKEYNKPIIVFIVEAKGVYMAAWIDLIIVDSKGRPIEAGTAQLDTRSSEPWKMFYVDENGQKKKAIIVHAGFGMERAFAAMLEKFAREGRAYYEDWLAPIQARVIPVSREYVARKLNELGVRADLDDSDETLGKKVRRAHTEWIRYIVVVGAQEKETGVISVTDRADGSKKEMKGDVITPFLFQQRLNTPVPCSEHGLYWGSITGVRAAQGPASRGRDARNIDAHRPHGIWEGLRHTGVVCWDFWGNPDVQDH